MHNLKIRKYTPIMVAVAVGVSLLVTSALASNAAKHRVAQPHGLAVFSHPPKGIAHIASANSATGATAPAGARLAAVVGNTEVYVDQPASGPSSGLDCVIHIAGGAGGGACGQPFKVEAEGMVVVSGVGGVERMTALLPNEVTSVKITDRSGLAYELAVKNNVIEQEDDNASTLTYNLAGGRTHTTEVAKLLSPVPTP
jgi:hypothetical protein